MHLAREGAAGGLRGHHPLHRAAGEGGEAGEAAKGRVRSGKGARELVGMDESAALFSWLGSWKKRSGVGFEY